VVEEEETDAARDARDWGAIDTTGIFRLSEVGSRAVFSVRKSSTWMWDCIVIKTDSAEVMHPLGTAGIRQRMQTHP